MKAWVVREERHGDPIESMKIEEIPKPEPGIGEIRIKVKAAGINYNHIWCCQGIPVPISRLHPDNPIHIGGSDAAGIVDAVGPGVEKWHPGDEVIVHPNQTCGVCAACNGYEPLSCLNQKAWGFETSWGSFAEYCLVQEQQVLAKPEHLSWEEASCYALKLFTAYRMLFTQCKVKPLDRVLIWGAAGGIGSYAVQLTLLTGGVPICVVSNEEKEEYCRQLGADLILRRDQFPHLSGEEDPRNEKEMRRFRKELRTLTGGFDPDIVFEHSGQTTFPTSVFCARRTGQVVICGGTSGYDLQFDVRYLWMFQKKIVGSHGCNLHDATRANLLVANKKIHPTLTKTVSFEDGANAHQEMLNNMHYGSWTMKVDS